MSQYITRVTRLSIMREDDAIFSETVTHVEIQDEAAGEYIVIRQINDQSQPGEVVVDGDDWSAIKAAVDQLLAESKP